MSSDTPLLIKKCQLFSGQDKGTFEDRHGVFEFKYVHSSSEVDGLVKEAIDQTQSRRYGEKTDGKELQANITLSFLFFSFVHHVARP